MAPNASILRPRRLLGRAAGACCVAAAFALLSPGVRVVRAGDAAPMSVDPTLLERRSPPPVPAASPAQPAPAPGDPTPGGGAVASPFVRAEDAANASRPGVPGIEVSPGIVVLNTRGFNYGPPPTPIAPEALAQEASPR